MKQDHNFPVPLTIAAGQLIATINVTQDGEPRIWREESKE